MRTTALSKPQYIATMVGRMTDITTSAQPVVDIWPYVGALITQNLVHPHVLEKNLVEHIYRNQDHSFDHILLPTSYINSFIVIIVDLRQKNIFGHFPLDLNEEYGINPPR